VGVNGGEGDRLGPPARIGALDEKAVHKRGVEPARALEPGTQFGDRVDPPL
jgi:hypothetical protein